MACNMHHMCRSAHTLIAPDQNPTSITWLGRPIAKALCFGEGEVFQNLDYYGWFLQNDYPSFKEAVAKLHKKIAD